MCDPMSALTTASLAMGAVSAVGGGISANQSAKYNAAEMERAAKVEEIRAIQAQEQAAREQGAFDRQAARQLGEQRVQMGASGLDMGSGTLLDIGVDTARELAIDRQNIGFQGDLNAWGHRNQASSLLNQASLTRSQGKNSLVSGVVSGGASLLGAAGGVYGGLSSSTSNGATSLGKAGKSSGKLTGSPSKSLNIWGR